MSHRILDIIQDKKVIKNINVVSTVIKANIKDLKKYVDKIKEKLDNSIVLLAAVEDGRIGFACGVTKELTKEYKAGDIVKTVAKITDGNGGGKPDFAPVSYTHLTLPTTERV